MNPIVRRIITALSTAMAVVLAIVYAPKWMIVPAFLVVIALAEMEYLTLLAKRGVRFPFSLSTDAIMSDGWFRAAAGGILILLGLSALPVIALKHGNLMMLYVIAIVKISDMGGFALGMSTAKLMKGGNHKMCPMVSPNKSWEGLLGSVLASCILSCLFMSVTHFGWGKSLVFGVTAALVGTAGDLVESKFKRWVGVKDSATFMPAGLGGFLDMFDSLLLAPAVLLPFI